MTEKTAARIAAVAGTVLVVGMFALLVFWPSWAFGANITYTFNSTYSSVPVKHTVQVCYNYSCGAEQVLTPALTQSIAATIPDSTFNYLLHRIWWYDSTEAPSTYYQTYCRTRISIADSNSLTYLASYGGLTADSAIVEWYRNGSATPYAADTGVNVDSLESTQYVLDTAQTEVVSIAQFAGQWGAASPFLICPASTQLLDTLVDSIPLDTTTVFVGGIADANGNDTVRIVVRDVANGTNVARAAVTVYGPSGQAVGSELTGLDGSVLAVLQQGYDYRVLASAVLYNGVDTVLEDVVAGFDTVFVNKIATADFTTRLYGTVVNNRGDSLAYARVTITPPDKVWNHCDSTVVMRQQSFYVYTGDGRTKPKGYWEADVIWSSCLGQADDSAYYKITVEANGYQLAEREALIAPDSSSYKVVFR